MVQLLWALHAFGAPAHREACRPIVGPLGYPQIQETAPSPHSSLGLAAACYSPRALTARVVGPTARGFHHRSRMRGDSHVRFLESLCQEDAQASCCAEDEGGPFETAL